jgi:uncharacterized protein YceK
MISKTLGLVFLSLCLLSGCATVPSARVFKPGFVKSPVYIAALSFEKVSQTWAQAGEWDQHVKHWRSIFWRRLARTVNQVQALSLNPDVKKGLIANPSVVGIDRNWNALLGGDDVMHIEVELVDAATNEKVAFLHYSADSSSAGWDKMSFDGRMEACADQAGYLLGRYFDKNQ